MTGQDVITFDSIARTGGNKTKKKGSVRRHVMSFYCHAGSPAPHRKIRRGEVFHIIGSEKGNSGRHYSTAVVITYILSSWVGRSCEMGSRVFDME